MVSWTTWSVHPGLEHTRYWTRRRNSMVMYMYLLLILPTNIFTPHVSFSHEYQHELRKQTQRLVRHLHSPMWFNYWSTSIVYVFCKRSNFLPCLRKSSSLSRMNLRLNLRMNLRMNLRFPFLFVFSAADTQCIVCSTFPRCRCSMAQTRLIFWTALRSNDICFNPSVRWFLLNMTL